MLVIPFALTLLILPGLPFAIWSARRAPLSRWAMVAAVPGASVAVNFIAVWAWPGDRITRPMTLLYLLLLAIASVAVAFPARRQILAYDWRRLVPPRDNIPRLATNAVLLATAFAVGMWVWTSGMGGLNQPPPNYDAAQHGFMTAHIIESGGVAIPDVMVTGPEGVSDHGEYYPFGVHSTSALISTASGNAIARSLNTFLVIMAAVVLPLGAFAFLRETLPDVPLAAGAAALVVTATESFPYKPISWGGIPLITGMCLLFGGATAVISMARRVPRSWVTALFVALALLGIWHAHNSEALLALGLAALVLMFDRVTTPSGAIVEQRWLRSSIMAVFRIGVISFLILLPIIPTIIRGGEERSTFDDTALGEPLASLGQIMFLYAGAYRNGVLLLVAVIGFAALVRFRRYSLPIAFVAIIVGAYYTATTDHRLSRALTFPWWRQAERMIYMASLLATLAVGALIGVLAITAFRKLRDRQWGFYVEPAVALIALLVITPSVLRHGAKAGERLVESSYVNYSPVSSASIEGFDVLHDVVGDDGSVLTEFNRDGSMWMYAYARAQPLYGIALADANVDPTWAERRSLAGSIGLIGNDPAVDDLIRKYRVRAIYWDDRTYAESKHEWSREQLRANPALEEVFTDGSVSVFKINLPEDPQP